MRAARYVGWIQRYATAILIASALVIGGAAYLAAFELPLRSDFSNLLPRDAPSVRAAERLAERIPAQDTMLMLIVANDPAVRAAAAQQAISGVRALDRCLVERIEVDDTDTRAFIRAHRQLFIPVAELQLARDALAKQLVDARLRANPMFIELEERAPASSALVELRAKQRAAEARLDRPAYVSADGRTQVIVIRTAFRGTDIERDLQLMKLLDGLATRIRGDHPTVAVGFAGGPPVTVAEHRALTRGILLSSLITAVLVALVLFVHLRSVKMLLLLTANIVAATLVSFGVAALSVGHLNAATAFLGAIIAGNGVNYGILLVARYLEERRKAAAPEAMATAIAGTVVPTLVASLGAAIAYGALAATQFRGFADFALIGGVGMLVCWTSSFVLLPAAILRWAPASRREPSPVFGRLVVRVFGFKRPAMACAIAGMVTLGSAGVAWQYLANDPFEYDMTELRSQARDAVETRRWLRISDENFGRGLAGLAGQTYIAIDRPEQVTAVVTALTAIAARDSIVGPISSILDAVPADQPRKLELLAELRGQIDQMAGLLDDAERAELLAIRPPDSLAQITARDLPRELAVKLTERDGRVGHMIAVRPGADFDERDGRDLIRFAAAVRQIRLADGETVAAVGPGVLFADVLTQIQSDGPLVTAIAAFGLIAMVLLVVGRTRRAFAVLVSTAAGSIAMIAVCALAGLKINFLDFVALPITLGLGIDYAINIADRAAHGDPQVALRSTGGTVFVCSLTTIIGYMSLLVSDNLSIRGFGLASLIGEITCMIAAFTIVPALVATRRRTTGMELSASSLVKVA